MDLDKFLFSLENFEKLNHNVRAEMPKAHDGGDFSSYAIANRGAGLVNSGIESHNLIAPKTRAGIYRCATAARKITSIADIGCGLGFV